MIVPAGDDLLVALTLKGYPHVVVTASGPADLPWPLGTILVVLFRDSVWVTVYAAGGGGRCTVSTDRIDRCTAPLLPVARAGRGA